MVNKSFAYEQSPFRQPFYSMRSTRSYPSALRAYAHYMRHNRSLARLGYFGREGVQALTQRVEIDEPLNPYSRLFMIIWALAMMAAVVFQSGKATSLSINRPDEPTATGRTASPIGVAADSKLASQLGTVSTGLFQKPNHKE